MDEADRLRAAMNCPTCGRTVLPAPVSTFLIAWYACADCDETWSARLRDGRPAIVWRDSELMRTTRGRGHVGACGVGSEAPGGGTHP